ncbi:Holliday junction resolvase RuvX [bacterium]|nr:Holliday junction resolvase RuvX [bacterium]
MAEAASSALARSAAEVFLGFDYGMRRIGVAVGDAVSRTARPLATVDSTQGPDWPHITNLLDDWKPGALVVGRPLTMAGQQQTMTRAAERFARRLHGRYHLPVHLAEERMTSLATQDMNVAEGSDAAAAAEILTDWLANHDD